MTEYQIKTLMKLRAEGLTSNKIAEAIGVTPGTVRTYISRHSSNEHSIREIKTENCCKVCGKPLIMTEGKRVKQFCSIACKNVWHNSRREPKEIKVCKHCGKEYRSYGNKQFCSRQCYLESFN